jgi:hypothetical protein
MYSHIILPYVSAEVTDSIFNVKSIRKANNKKDAANRTALCIARLSNVHTL